MKKWTRILLVMVFLSGCQPGTSTPAQPTEAASPAVLTEAPTPAEAAEPLPLFSIDWSKPFASSLDLGVDLELGSWDPAPYAGMDLALPFSYTQVHNGQVVGDLTADQLDFLSQNGFVVIHSQEAQFGDIRVETALRSGQPYYLTTDAAFHALHLLFDDMLKEIEREYFRPQMMDILQAVLAQVETYLPASEGTSIAGDVIQATAYLSTALRLFDPSAAVDPSLADLVERQVEQIMNADGRGMSVIFPDFEDDYGAYKPVGHYAGDPDLEAYFRGMTWFGRMHFLLEQPDNPLFVPSRLPLVVTLALRNARVDGQPASDEWASMHEILTFVIGPSDDAGPLEYAALMDQVYGTRHTIQHLADETLWQDFLANTDQLPAPQINSLFVDSTMDLAPVKGWRFMGQRFTLDGLIFQNVIFDRVQDKPDKTRRDIPSGLDVMAAFGSAPAFDELEAMQVTQFPNYPEQLTKMHQSVQAQPEAQWLARFYDGWLYSFLPVVMAKDGSYPAAMQTKAWGYKDLNAALGSWAELKHDTILYTKMPEAAGGGGPPMSESAPSYVEPNPTAFYRMAYMAQMLSCGLQERLLEQPCSSSGYFDGSAGGTIAEMFKLGSRFAQLGDIAVRELAGQPLSQDENNLITSCLGLTECLNLVSMYSLPAGEMPRVPVIAAVSGSDQGVLEVGVGNVDRIYVVVPLEGSWQIAQGGVFSYYEFVQPRSQRLTDDEWRAKLDAGGVELPAWAANFVLPGGQSVEWLAFRIGDVYHLSEAGADLNVRESPSIGSQVLVQLTAGAYVQIVDGPIEADGHTWWKIRYLDYQSEPQGWVVENQEWYLRSYHP